MNAKKCKKFRKLLRQIVGDLPAVKYQEGIPRRLAQDCQRFLYQNMKRAA